jgi:acetoin utilization deacetylase AcuC-like enzyme
MTTALFTHPVCIDHDPGSGHPESPGRLKSVMDALAVVEFEALDRREAPVSDLVAIKAVHQPEFVDLVMENIPETGQVFLDPDTALSPQSGNAALRAVGGCLAAVDAVMEDEIQNAFCAVRPPGHHAESSRSMGFCVFNNVVVAADYARTKHGLSRVAVVDFDVHHGNGTQHFFEKDQDLFYASSHQFPYYPGTGAKSETGVGNIVNLPMAAGEGSDAFRKGYSRELLPALREFDPDLLIISAGFDAHARDPLAEIGLTEDDFTWVTQELRKIAEDCCDGRLVSSLEGGYNLDALALSTAAHVRVLLEK